MGFDTDVFHGHLIQGNLKAALSYLSRFPEEAPRLERYTQLFERAQYIQYPIEESLNAILRFYQIYYREVFYLGIEAQRAEQNLLCRLASHLSLQGQETDLDALEDTRLAPHFQQHGFHFMGGKTGGYYGPYVWKDTQKRAYSVELPEGIQPYAVYFHQGFVSNSWLSYLSLGAVGTGGWTDADGGIHCIAEKYDEQGEDFQVSLLKHEAQHARDLCAFPNMRQEQLEYRAKLVELIYSQQRDLLPKFAAQSGSENAHALASRRITKEFAGISARESVQLKARELFFQSLEA